MEEVKVKDAIIKADELLRDSQSTSKKTEDDTDTEVHIQNRRNIIRCNKCEWTSPNQAQLPGHMLKHEGQYICPKCKLGYKTKKEMNEHMQAQHKVQQDSVNLACISCDKTFPSQHSLKQHLNSKHKKEEELPVGHPQRAQNKNNESPKIACVQCDRRFSTGREVQDHMLEHTGNKAEQSFKTPVMDKVCRYFQNGFCRKGDQCLFKHTDIQTNSTPMCGRGQGCFFF